MVGNQTCSNLADRKPKGKQEHECWARTAPNEKEEATPLSKLTRHSAPRSKAQSKREAGQAFQKLKIDEFSIKALASQLAISKMGFKVI